MNKFTLKNQIIFLSTFTLISLFIWLGFDNGNEIIVYLFLIWFVLVSILVYTLLKILLSYIFMSAEERAMTREERKEFLEKKKAKLQKEMKEKRLKLEKEREERRVKLEKEREEKRLKLEKEEEEKRLKFEKEEEEKRIQYQKDEEKRKSIYMKNKNVLDNV